MCNDRLPRENANTTTEMYPHPIKEQKKKKKCSNSSQGNVCIIFVSHMFDLHNPLPCLLYFIFIDVTYLTIDIIEKESYLHKCLDSMFHNEEKKKKNSEFK